MHRISGALRPPIGLIALALLLLVVVAATAGAETRVLTIYFHGTGSGLDPLVFAYPGATATLYLADQAHPFTRTIREDFCLPLGSPVVTSAATDPGYSHYKFSVEGIASRACATEFVDPDAGPRGWSAATGEALLAIRAAMGANPNDTWILNLVGHSRGGVLTMTTARAAVSAPDIEPKIEKINILAYDPVPGCGDPIGRLGSSFKLPPKVSQYVALYSKHHMQFSFEPVIPVRESASTTMWMSIIPGSHTDLVGALNYRYDIAAVGMAIGVQLLSSPNWGSVAVPGYLSSVGDASTFAGYVNAIAQGDYTGAMNDGGLVGFSWLVGCNDDGMIRADTLWPWRVLNARLAFVAPERHVGHNAPWWCGFIWINVEKVFWLHEQLPDLAPGDWATLQSLRGAPPPDSDPPIPMVDPLPPIASSCPVTLVPPKAHDAVSGSIDATTANPLSYSVAGSYVVTWTYTDRAGNFATQTQSVVLTADTKAPDIEPPANIVRYLDASAAGPWVVVQPDELGTARAGDACGPVTIDRSGVPAGNAYPPGTTSIRYASTDVWGNTGVAYQTVTVAITAPPDVSVSTPPDATSCEALISDAELGSIGPIPGLTIARAPAGNAFAVGTTTVTWMVSDGSGHSATATQTVTVADGTPPRIAAPAAVTAFTGPSAAGCGVVIDTASIGSPVASDNCTLAPVVPSGIPAGNVFPVGTTTITWNATDAAGLTATATQTVTVKDDTPPAITAPANVVVSTAADGPGCGVVVSEAALGVATATDNCEVRSVAHSQLPTGNIFPIGTTAVTWTATDAAGNTATASQTVTVLDATLPLLTVPDNVVAPAGSSCTAVVTWNASATDCSAVTVVSDPPSGSVFPLGTTHVTVAATDAAGNLTSGGFDVTVVDVAAPAITGISASPAVLWPPNHKLVDVTIAYTAADNCAAGTCILGVVSNEPINGTDDGDTAPDWEIVGPHTVRLRAERAGTGSGRVYTVTISCTDVAGNVAERSVIVTAPLATR